LIYREGKGLGTQHVAEPKIFEFNVVEAGSCESPLHGQSAFLVFSLPYSKWGSYKRGQEVHPGFEEEEVKWIEYEYANEANIQNWEVYHIKSIPKVVDAEPETYAECENQE
jgi:hypothetical protein